jgi:hypothetical protein
MEARLLVPLLALTLGSFLTAYAAPTTVAGDPFTLVGMGGGTPLFGLTSDAAGRIYIGNNSNVATGIAVQLFDPALFTGTAISLQNFGPAVGDADGIASFGDSIFVADGPEGLRQLAVADAANSIYLAGVATNATGSRSSSVRRTGTSSSARADSRGSIASTSTTRRAPSWSVTPRELTSRR